MAELRADGRLTEAAEQLLASFEEVQRQREAHFARLKGRPTDFPQERLSGKQNFGSHRYVESTEQRSAPKRARFHCPAITAYDCWPTELFSPMSTTHPGRILFILFTFARKSMSLFIYSDVPAWSARKLHRLRKVVALPDRPDKGRVLKPVLDFGQDALLDSAPAVRAVAAEPHA